MVYYYRCYVNKHINDNVHCESFFSIIIRMNGVSNADDNIKSAILNKDRILSPDSSDPLDRENLFHQCVPSPSVRQKVRLEVRSVSRIYAHLSTVYVTYTIDERAHMRETERNLDQTRTSANKHEKLRTNLMSRVRTSPNEH